MEYALAMVLLVAACGVEEPAAEVDAVEQAVVSELPIDEIPVELADLIECIDLPEQLDGAWIKERLVYNDTCFASWSVNVGISDCQIGDAVVNGAVVVAGPAMQKLPRRGFLIRTRAALAALVDLANFFELKILPRVDVSLDGPGMELAACAAPIGNKTLHSELELAVDTEILGSADVSGFADVQLADEMLNIDYLVSMTAEPNGGPVIEGELAGTGIVRNADDFCPQAGQVTFGGSIGEKSAEVVLEHIGDGQSVLTMSDGQQYGPHAAPRCR